MDSGKLILVLKMTFSGIPLQIYAGATPGGRTTYSVFHTPSAIRESQPYKTLHSTKNNVHGRNKNSHLFFCFLVINKLAASKS